MKISLCLLVWNELEGCKIDVPLLPLEAFDEVYAIDGGSLDGTVVYLESQKIPVYQQRKRGLNAAYIEAVELSNCDAVVVFFPKATLDPNCLRNFRALFDEGYELVVASRNISGGRNEEDSHFFKPRKWGVSMLSCFASVLWRREGYRIRDVLHGVKGFTVAAFRDIDPLDHGLSIDLEMVVRSYRLKISRAEFPVHEEPRVSGCTHFKLLPTSKKLLKYLLFELGRKKGVRKVGDEVDSMASLDLQ